MTNFTHLINIGLNDAAALSELHFICKHFNIELDVQAEDNFFSCFVSDLSKLKKENFDPYIFNHDDLNLKEELNLELTPEEKALKIKMIYNLNLKSNRVILAKRVIKGGQKTVLLNYGFSNKRAKVWFVELRNRIFLTVGGSGYKLTLDQFINGDFEIKRIPKEPQVLRSSNGWASLEKLMNKTWSK